MRNTIIVPVLRVLVILILAVLAFMPSCNAQVYFNTASAEVSAEGQAALINVANDLIANPSRRIQLIGYTDPRGSEAYNLDLASRRCNAVRSILIGLGVDSARILILPFGEDVNAATLKEGRRVEMHGFSTEFGEGDQTSTNATLEMDSTSATHFATEDISQIDSLEQGAEDFFAQSATLVDTVVVRDTVVRQVVDTIIQTVQASPCGCENMNAAQKWVRYMELRKEIRKEADPFRKDILVACRLAIGREVRTQHRYDGRLAKEDAPKAKLMSNRGGQKGLAKAKARRFWRSVGKWFKSIGSCRRV